MRERAGAIGPLVLLTALAACLRAWPIARRPLWLDEVHTWYVAAHLDALQMLRWHLPDPKHSPLNFLVTKLAMTIAGSEQAWVLRLPSLLLGVLCVPLVYVVGRALHSSTFGLLLALLVAVDPILVDQSQQARMYTMLAVAAWSALGLAASIVRDPHRSLAMGGLLGLALAAALWAHPLAAALWGGVGAAGAWACVAAWRRGQAARARAVAGQLGSALLMAVAFGHLGLVVWAQRLLWSKADAPAEGGDVWRDPARIAALFGDPWLTGIFIVAAVCGLVRLARRAPVAPLVATAIATIAMLLAMVSRQGFLAARYFVLVEPAVFAGLAFLPLASARRAWRVAGGAFVAACAVVFAVRAVDNEHPDAWPDQYEVATRTAAISDSIQPGDAVLFDPGWCALIGARCELPLDIALQDELLGQGPAAKTLPQRAWLVATRIGSEERANEVAERVRLLALRYGVAAPAQLERQILIGHPLVVRVDARGVHVQPPSAG